MKQKAAWILSMLLLLNTGGIGLYNGVTEMPDAQTALQRSVTIGVLLYGVLGLAAAVWLSAAWAVVVTYVASTAAFAYAAADATVGAALAGGLGAAAIGILVVWCARTVTAGALSP